MILIMSLKKCFVSGNSGPLIHLVMQNNYQSVLTALHALLRGEQCSNNINVVYKIDDQTIVDRDKNKCVRFFYSAMQQDKSPRNNGNR